MTVDLLEALLAEEAGRLNGCASLLEELQAVVTRKEWDRLDISLARMKTEAAAVEEVEERRHSSFNELKASLGLDAGAGFAQLIAVLEPAERDGLAAAYRRLKISVIRIHSVAGRLGYMVQSLSAALLQVLEELFPHRKGRIYSRSGKARSTREESLVVNRRL